MIEPSSITSFFVERATSKVRARIDELGDVYLYEVFEDDVLADVELVFGYVVNDVANNVIVFENHVFEILLIHGRAKCSIGFKGVTDKLTYVSHL